MTSRHPFRSLRITPLGAVFSVLLVAEAPMARGEDGDSARVAYRETFPAFHNPHRFIRTAAAADGWEVLEEPGGGRFLRVTLTPQADRLRALVIWDLAPLQFNRLAVRMRSDAPIFLSGVGNDRFGNAYFFKPYGEAGEGGGKRVPLPANGQWTDYRIEFPRDLVKITGRGREVSPFVFGSGEALADWEGVDFTNLGIKAIFFHLDTPAKSPSLGRPMHVDFQFLELSSAAALASP